MAATDQSYRNQRYLDAVFGVSCVLMLVSIVGMFAQDYFREFKREQRQFRDVEEALADRDALQALPDPAEITKAEERVKAAQQAVEGQRDQMNKLERDSRGVLLAKVKHEADYQALKADYDSQASLFNIAVENFGSTSPEAAEHKATVENLQAKLIAKQREFEAAKTELDGYLQQLDQLKEPLTKALEDLKRLNSDFDRIAKNAREKRWGWGDTIRNLPVIDGFAAPTKIEQYTLDDLPIDYSFKRVTRYDRCTTCHKGIERGNFDKASLRGLAEISQEQFNKLESARQLIRNREQVLHESRRVLQGNGEQLGYSPSDLRLRELRLDESRTNEFCAHPRLDLYVDANSPHPAEKFGCSICHSGQGSATAFDLASHTPNDAAAKRRWIEDHGWYSNHYWDFPMMPKRFTESSCLKCHYQVTDLIREGNKNEAPKLIAGHNLIKKAGCFGCHEISGIKSGRWVGPDLRLEPWPPLDSLTPAERVKATADPLTPPGTLRKAGPSLRRIVEKTNEAWVRKWLRAPRDFRATTWMPHFYGLSNNDQHDLQGTGQEKFPEAEMYAVAYYLFNKSNAYFAGQDPFKLINEARKKDLEARLARDKKLSEQDQKKLDDAINNLKLAVKPVSIAQQLIEETGKAVQLPDLPKDDKGRTEQLTRGRMLFSERGCLACHSHQATTTAGQGVPAVTGDAQFGPDLGRIAGKLGTKPGDQESARRWLVQWILNPTIHHPRTYMPNVHLTVEQANDIAAWLLGQEVPPWQGQDQDVPEPELDTLKKLARVYLDKVTTRHVVDNLLNPTPDDLAKTRAGEWLKQVRVDSDEQELAGGVTAESLKLYIGRKAISNLGCFGCHDIPGFETAKPIGTPLNEWGKKDPERLAFEDIKAFVDGHYHVVDHLADKDGKPAEFHGDHAPYEAYFYEQLIHHQRDGFIYQKLREPRSYDYGRLRAWDDRLRMPQFKFAKPERKQGESEEAFHARSEKEEAEAREAVMTFILGLVAEPVPPKYVHAPRADRDAEVKGRQVLDKYNCGGCHQVRPGIYEFKKTPAVIQALSGFAQAAGGSAATDHPFPDHSAWMGRAPARSDRLIAYGVPGPDQPENTTVVRLTEGLRVQNNGGVRNIPAASSIAIGQEEGFVPRGDVLSESAPFGGTFAELLVPYLRAKDKTLYGDYKNARAALPPPLFREGEKVQPDWLFQFLRNPQAIRPVTVLRMPRFNMSDEEAMALVNYFAAVDKMNNPAEGLSYPYMAIPQRDEHYWQAKSQAYVARLGKDQLAERYKALEPIWEQYARDRLSDVERSLKNIEDALKSAKDDDARQDAAKTRDALRKDLDQLKTQIDKKSFDALNRQWTEKEAFAADAWRLLANYNNPCLSCHQVGALPPKQPQGPPLDLSWERLRPEWTLRWIANPDRLISYPTPMPQNFARNEKPYPQFSGTILEQAEAMRDILLNLPRVAELPANRYYRPPAATAEGAKP